jgi:hypothetical protein
VSLVLFCRSGSSLGDWLWKVPNYFYRGTSIRKTLVTIGGSLSGTAAIFGTIAKVPVLSYVLI